MLLETEKLKYECSSENMLKQISQKTYNKNLQILTKAMFKHKTRNTLLWCLLLILNYYIKFKTSVGVTNNQSFGASFIKWLCVFPTAIDALLKKGTYKRCLCLVVYIFLLKIM